jgi:hypothetical protein
LAADYCSDLGSSGKLLDTSPKEAYFPQEMRARLLCELEQLCVGEGCANQAAYSITISYLGRPALTLNLCKLHILETWNLAQSSTLQYGNSTRVKSVAVKKIEEEAIETLHS